MIRGRVQAGGGKSRAKLSRTSGAEAGKLEGVADVMESKLFRFFFQRGDEAFIEAAPPFLSRE